MKANEFLNDFGNYNALYARAYAEKRTQALRDARIIPKGLRGPHAPDLEPMHMALLLIGLTAADPDTVKAVTTYANMSAIGDRWFDGADDFESALTKVFAEHDYLVQVQEVIICRSWPEATIVMTDGRSFTFSTLEPPSYEKRSCRIDYRIGWHFLHSAHCHYSKTLSPKPSRGGWEYRVELLRIAKEQGDEAAEKWIKENPEDEWIKQNPSKDDE